MAYTDIILRIFNSAEIIDDRTRNIGPKEMHFE